MLVFLDIWIKERTQKKKNWSYKGIKISIKAHLNSFLKNIVGVK